MKALLHIIISTLFLVIFSCNNSRQKGEITSQSSVSDTSATETENAGTKIANDDTKIPEYIYVVERTGAEIKQRADKNAKTLGTYEFGTNLEVIEEAEAWFGVRDKTTGKKVYLLKSKTGSIDEVTLIPSDLAIIYSLKTNKSDEYFEKGKELKGFFEIELISKRLFDSKKNSSVDLIIADTTGSKKVNGTTTLKCRERVVKYIDKPYIGDESRQEFRCAGQIEFLNHYLVVGEYWESSEYKFIDKISGKETQTFGEYPNISPDKKHIICIYADYESPAELKLYSIDNKNIKHKMSISFKNWISAESELGELFWSTDGYLYLPVNHISSFLKQGGGLNDQRQYIRIKIL